MLWNWWGYLRDIFKLRFMGLIHQHVCLWRSHVLLCEDWFCCSPKSPSGILAVDGWEKHQPYFLGSCKISEKNLEVQKLYFQILSNLSRPATQRRMKDHPEKWPLQVEFWSVQSLDFCRKKTVLSVVYWCPIVIGSFTLCSLTFGAKNCKIPKKTKKNWIGCTITLKTTTKSQWFPTDLGF
jgi:hypothetical protein